MDVRAQIHGYIAAQAQPKRDDLQTLHELMLKVSPDCRLWFLDGRNDVGKVVSNPSVGYGVQTTRAAGSETGEFYQVGFSANTTGISLYIMNVRDNGHLARTYGPAIGKAKITGYCVKFRRLSDLDLSVLEQLVANHLGVAAASAALT